MGEELFKYEALIEDYHGHLDWYQYKARNDSEAYEQACYDGFNNYACDDKLWRVGKEYLDRTGRKGIDFNNEMKKYYVEIDTKKL